jgi:hypothetical protein
MAWGGYRIYPHRTAKQRATVAVLGHTTGSHPGLADEAESRLTLIWLAAVRDGALRSWRLIEDTPANRRQFGLDDDG